MQTRMVGLILRFGVSHLCNNWLTRSFLAENNPANDYPDEELSSSDEDDDPTAIYGKYRRHGVSDDEEFDIDDSGSEGGARFGSAFGYRQRYGGNVDSDEESY